MADHPQKLVLSSSKGLSFINSNDIIHCKSKGNYTTLYLTDNRQLIVCKSLGVLERLLPAEKFLRVHHSHVIRTDCIMEYLQKSRQLLLSDGSLVPVAKRKKKDLISHFTAT